MTLLYRRPRPTPVVPTHAVRAPVVPAHSFRAWTESLYVSGRVRGEDRLSDVLNAREPILVEQPRIIPLGETRTAQLMPPELEVDPFDFEFVLGMASERSGDPSHEARRIHKVRYPVHLRGTSFDVWGTIHMFAGNAPEYATQHRGALFMPVTDATVRRQGRVVSDLRTDVVLVNRYSIKSISQVDSV